MGSTGQGGGFGTLHVGEFFFEHAGFFSVRHDCSQGGFGISHKGSGITLARRGLDIFLQSSQPAPLKDNIPSTVLSDSCSLSCSCKISQSCKETCFLHFPLFDRESIFRSSTLGQSPKGCCAPLSWRLGTLHTFFGSLLNHLDLLFIWA